MVKEYKKGLVEIVSSEEEDRCDSCNRPVGKPVDIYKNGKLAGRYGRSCAKPKVEEAIEDNENSRFGRIHPRLAFVDYFKRPKIRDVRAFERVTPEGSRRSDVAKAFLTLESGQYLDIPPDVETVPEVDNWKKKGDFIEFAVRRKEEIDERSLSPKDLARSSIGRNNLAYAGIMFYNRTDNRFRVFSLTELIEGRKIAYLCSQEGIDENIELVEDYGRSKTLLVPSTSERGRRYAVRLDNLPVEPDTAHSRALDVYYSTHSPWEEYSTLPHSNRNLKRKMRNSPPWMRFDGKFKLPPVRPDKFACAAIEYLMSREDNDVLVDPRPVIPSNEACGFENTMMTRAVYQSRLLSFQESEVLLWMSANKNSMGYEKMFS